MDKIQAELIKAGRKDLAQKYYEKIAQSLPSDVDDQLYNTPVKLKGYNGKPTVLSAHGKDAGDALIQLRPEITKAQHSQLSKKFFDMAKKMEDDWGKVADKAAQETWGRDFGFGDYKISGIGSDEFSEKYKNKLRTLAHGSSKAKAIAHAHEYASKSRRISAAFTSKTLWFVGNV